MANILNLITIGEKQYLIVDADPSAAGGTSAPLGDVAVYENGSVAKLYLKTGSSDTNWDLINTAAVAGIVNNGAAGRVTVYGASGNVVGDVYVQNSQNMYVSHVAQPTRSAAITYQIPNPGDAVTSANFVLTEGTQTINGDKTFSGNTVMNGGLQVNGTLTYINTTNTNLSDPTVTLNKGGGAASSAGAGIEFEEASTITGYIEVDSTRNGYIFKAPNVASTADVLLSSLTGNRSYTLPDVSGTFAIGTGAVGGVAYWNSLNTITYNPNFFWDNTNTRLGIGNGAPSATLHVTGSARITGLNSAAPVRSDASGNLSNGTIVLSATSDVSGILPIANGGTNSGTALNNSRIMVSAGGQIVEAAALSNGQLLIGSTGLAPVAANITQTGNNGVVITNGAGSISLSTVQDIRTTASPSFVGLTLSSLTQGSVIFAGSGGVISQDNTKFFWDDTNFRLGLNTGGPARTLDVNGATFLRGSLRYVDAASTNANWEMFQAQVSTTDATVTTVASITVPTDSALLLQAQIVGRRTGGTGGANGDASTYIRTARYKNVGGTVTINNLQSDYTSEDQGSWNGTLDVSGTAARIRVNGSANNNVNWTVTYTVITLP